MKSVWLTSVIGAVFALSACSTLDGLVDETVPVADLPAAGPDWVEPAPDQLPSTDWIAQFDDPRLTQFVEEAIIENPSLRRAIAQFDASLASARISRAALYPSLSTQNNVTRSEGGTGFRAGSTQYNFGINASWEADVFGRVRDQVDADLAGAQASAADLAGVRVSLAGQVASTWFDAIEADRLVELSEREIATRERSLRLTSRRFESGLTGASDVRLAKSSLASSEALREARIQQRNATVRTLQTLLRDYPDADLRLPEALPFLPVLEGAGSPETMVARRPDILAAEARIAQSGLNVDAARKALLPSLSLTSGAAEQALNLGDALDFTAIALQLTASLTAPIFQAGRLRGQVEAQQAQLAANLESYAETVLTAYREVENALDAEGRLASRETSLREALQEAELAEQRLEQRYTEGLATILQLLDAQQRRISAEGQLIGARAERLANRVRLHVALGGGRFSAAPPAELAPIDIPLIGGLLPGATSAPSTPAISSSSDTSVTATSSTATSPATSPTTSG